MYSDELLLPNESVKHRVKMETEHSPFLPKANSPELFAKSANEHVLADVNAKGRPAGAKQRRQMTPNKHSEGK